VSSTPRGIWSTRHCDGGPRRIRGRLRGEYREIVTNERIETTEVYEGAPGAFDQNAPLNVTTFKEADGRTTLELLVQAGSREVRDIILESGMRESMDLPEEVAISLR
jgi:uncharacterized protein YndB with AHSA1/START domain